MDQNYEIPVFLIDGFLDSGKTTFITETIERDSLMRQRRSFLLSVKRARMNMTKLC